MITKKTIAITMIIAMLSAFAPVYVLCDEDSGENGGEFVGDAFVSEGYTGEDENGEDGHGGDDGSGENDGETGMDVTDGSQSADNPDQGWIGDPGAYPAGNIILPQILLPSVSVNEPVFECHRPESYDNVLVGDSRTVAIYQITRRGACNTAFICQVGAGYGWFSSAKVNNCIREYASKEKNLNLIINMGVNDTENLARYAKYLNDKEEEWRALGYKLYYVSVNPVANGHSLTNATVDNFNFELENSLSGYSWLNTNSYLKRTGYTTSDALHYDKDTTDKIYEYIVMNVD